MTGTVYELFERQARATPEAVAVVFGDRQLTYRSLDTQSAGIARALQDRGVGPETVVGICGSRSPDAVAALLGVLRAGGAYAALNSQDPRERLRSIVTSARIGVLLLSDMTVTIEFDGIEAVQIEQIAETGTPESVSVSADHLAAVIYTSGSSGRPKGIALSHRSIVSRLLGPTAHLPTEPRLQKTSFSLIGHLSDLLIPLVHGWPAILIDDDTARNPPTLVEAIVRYDVHRLFLVPSMLRIFLEVPEAEMLRGQLHTLLVSGERLPRELATRVRERFPEATLVHAYGLSETAGTVCQTVIRNDGEITIGKPPEGTVEIVTDSLDRVALGEVGEIAVGGPSLARGYLNEPELTAERFRPNPFLPFGRICLTGDLGRFLPDGRIELLGRRDREVKLHGLRVNLSDVEEVLERQPEVERAAALRCENERGEGVLRAFVTVKDASSELSADRCREHLHKSLPGFMVPTDIRVVDQMPLLANGKVDHQVLSTVSHGPSTTRRQGISNGSRRLHRTEAALAEIWAAELGYVEGETSDDFFVLGGDSLTAIRVGLRIQQRWAFQTPLRVVLEHPTLSEMARWIEGQRRDAALPVVPPSGLGRSADDGHPTLSVQQNMGLLYELTCKVTSSRNTQPQVRVGLRIVGDLDPVLIEDSVNAVVSRHEILRTAYRPVFEAGPLRLEGWVPLREAVAAGRVDPRQISWEPTIHQVSITTVPVVDLEHRSAGDVEDGLQATIGRVLDESFDCASHPLIRVCLVKVSRGEHRLLVVMPHLVADTASLNIFLNELFCLYLARRDNTPARLPLPELQYADFAQYQSERLQAARREIEPQHEKAGDPTPLLEAADLRFGRLETRGVIGLVHYEAREQSTWIPEEECRAILSVSGKERVTLSMFVFACFGTYLHLQSGVNRFRITITQANRTHPALADVFGFVASGQRIGIAIADNPSFGRILQQVRNEFSEAAQRGEVSTPEQARHGIGYEFNQLRVPRVKGLSIEPFRMRARQRAEYGLKLTVEERPDGLELGLEYCVDCFDHSPVVAMLRDLRNVLSRAVAEPSRRVSAFSDCLLTSAATGGN